MFRIPVRGVVVNDVSFWRWYFTCTRQRCSKESVRIRNVHANAHSHAKLLNCNRFCTLDTMTTEFYLWQKYMCAQNNFRSIFIYYYYYYSVFFCFTNTLTNESQDNVCRHEQYARRLPLGCRSTRDSSLWEMLLFLHTVRTHALTQMQKFRTWMLLYANANGAKYIRNVRIVHPKIQWILRSDWFFV